MSSTAFQDCKTLEPTSSNYSAINWPSTSSTSTSAETTCPKSVIGPGRTNECARPQLRLQQSEELSLPTPGFNRQRCAPGQPARMYLGREDRVGERQHPLHQQELPRS